VTSERQRQFHRCVTSVQEKSSDILIMVSCCPKAGPPPTNSLFSGRSRAALTRSSLERIVGFSEDRGRDPLRVRLRWAS